VQFIRKHRVPLQTLVFNSPEENKTYMHVCMCQTNTNILDPVKVRTVNLQTVNQKNNDNLFPNKNETLDIS